MGYVKGCDGWVIFLRVCLCALFLFMWFFSTVSSVFL